MHKKTRQGALGLAGTLALVFFNRPTRTEIVWLVIPIAILLMYGFSGWIEKRGLSVAERMARFGITFAFCSIGIFLYASHFWLQSVPDVRCVMWGRNELRFAFNNVGNETGRTPKYWSAVTDFSNPYYPPDQTLPQFVPTVAETAPGDFVLPREFQGMRPIINTPEGKSHIRQDDILTGVLYLTCENCAEVRAYYFYFVVGRGGWYAEAPDWKKVTLAHPINTNAPYDAIQRYEDSVAPKNTRIEIPENPPGDGGALISEPRTAASNSPTAGCPTQAPLGWVCP